MAVRLTLIIEIRLVPFKICVGLLKLLSQHNTECFCHAVVEKRLYQNAFYFLHNAYCLGSLDFQKEEEGGINRQATKFRLK